MDALADTVADVSRQIAELAPSCTRALVYEMVKIRKSTFWIRLAKLRPRAAYSDQQYWKCVPRWRTVELTRVKIYKEKTGETHDPHVSRERHRENRRTSRSLAIYLCSPHPKSPSARHKHRCHRTSLSILHKFPLASLGSLWWVHMPVQIGPFNLKT